MTEPSTPARLLARCRRVFREVFHRPPEVAAAAPGRVNLIGEHTDYNEGWVLPIAIDRRTGVVAAPHGTRACRVVAGDLGGAQSTFSISELYPDDTTWSSYVKGVVAGARAAGLAVPPFDAAIASDVPLGAGLSSSAALELATLTAIERLGGASLAARTKATWAQWAEHHFAGVPCGIMDQMVVSTAEAGHAMLLDCRTAEAEPVPFSDPSLAVVVADTGVSHSLAASEYARRREECERAARLLRERDPSIASLRDATPAHLAAARDALGDTLHRRASHVVSENERVLRAADAMRRGDWECVGELMNASHASLRDDYAVSCDELDTLAAIGQRTNGVVGARMTGAGFGGCTIHLVRRERAEDLIEALRAGYSERFGKEPDCYVTTASEGARPIPVRS